MWNQDLDFLSWLDDEELGTDENPLDDDTLELMYQAWTAGFEFGKSRNTKMKPYKIQLSRAAAIDGNKRNMLLQHLAKRDKTKIYNFAMDLSAKLRGERGED